SPLIKVEALRIRNMIGNHKLAKSIADAGWGTFFRILESKAEEAGGLVMYVNPSGTSKDLSVRRESTQRLVSQGTQVSCLRAGHGQGRSVRQVGTGR
ncbi:MAG: IS200/IS605 family accessory protein TnpB-related protein, partial [Actinobacteria bacterium]|nr:IS200/IS605 family accessory protein TnpB-related protein [Actinomycetota bacterium]